MLRFFLQFIARAPAAVRKIMKNILILAFMATIVFLAVQNAFSHPAWGIVVDRQGQVYFSDLETIWKIDRQGNVTTFRAGVSGRHVHNITIDAEDNIYGLDNSYNAQKQTFPRSIWKMSPKGEISYLVPMTDNLPPGRSIWRDSDGNTYSVEPYNNEKKEAKIIRFAPDSSTSLFAGGKYGSVDGPKEKAQFGVITDMIFGADKTIYLSDEDKVRRIDKAGAVTTIYSRQISSDKNAKTPEQSSRIFGLAVDERNNVFAADPENRRIIKISPGGEYTPVFSTEQPWRPYGVALDKNDLYVMESWFDEKESFIGTRVRKLSSDGRVTVLATVGDQPKQSATDNPAVENIPTSSNDQKSFLYILFGAVVGLVVAIPVVRYGYRKLFA
jgi:hypothetical protein